MASTQRRVASRGRPTRGNRPRHRYNPTHQRDVAYPGWSWHGICLPIHLKFRVRIRRWIDYMQTSLHSKPVVPRTISRRARRPSQRRATVVLEFIVVLPILIIVMVGTVKFGVFYANMQQVALAARVGAEEASQTGSLPGSDGGQVPANVLLAIEQQLETAGITYCRVRLEHNVGGDRVELFSPSKDACGEGGGEQLLVGGLPHEYVRLTVSVRLTEVMADSMGCFSFSPDAAEKTAFATTIFRYEL